MASLPQKLALAVQRVLRSPGPNQVHDLRVAIRRFHQFVALNSQNRNLPRLKAVMKRAGEVRNMDITMKMVGKVEGTERLQARLRRERQQAANRLKEELKGCPLPDKLPESKPAHVRQTAVAAITRLFDRGAAAKRAKELHKVRIAAKKLRYTLELVAPRHPRLEEIKRLQSELGRINDYRAARELVKRKSGDEAVLDQLLKDKQQKKIRAFQSCWSGILQDRAVARRWIRELSAARS